MSEIGKILRREVGRQGIMPFVEFMRLALYCPNYGYYEQVRRRIGREGDFFTSVSTGNLFGELLAFQYAEWLQNLSGSPMQLVEAGAHDGQLAADILVWLRKHRPEMFPQLQYWIIEPSPRRRAWQEDKLEDFADHVRWFESLAEIAAPGVYGVIFSNELLDAMPLHRLGWDAESGRWFEWGVTLAESLMADEMMVDRQKRQLPSTRNHPSVDQPQFAWKKMRQVPDYLKDQLERAGLVPAPELQAVLPNGFIIEICPEAEAWWRQAAVALKCGKLMTIDYGFQAEALFAPERANGTLRAYFHHSCGDALVQPGERDLTAHVNFTQLQRVGEEAGLVTETFCSHERFFTPIAAKTWQKGSRFGDWSSAQVRQFQTLTHPEHLGRPFSVLVQGKRARQLN